MNPKRVFLIVSSIGVFAGLAVGYAVATVEAVSELPFMESNRSPRTDFGRTVEDFSRLGVYESAAANCRGTSDEQLAISREGEVIRDLQQRKAVDTSLLNLAEAKFLVRTIVATEKNPSAQIQTNTALRVDGLLGNAGWTNPSEEHLREIIQELDRDQCRLVGFGAGR
jgi:hypothetical protein